MPFFIISVPSLNWWLRRIPRTPQVLSKKWWNESNKTKPNCAFYPYYDRTMLQWEIEIHLLWWQCFRIPLLYLRNSSALKSCKSKTRGGMVWSNQILLERTWGVVLKGFIAIFYDMKLLLHRLIWNLREQIISWRMIYISQTKRSKKTLKN